MILVMVALVGCGQDKLDGSSNSKFKESLSKVRAYLGNSERKEFDKSLLCVTFSMIEELDEIPEEAMSKEKKREILMSVDGKTAEDIIEMAKKKKSNYNQQVRNILEKEKAKLLSSNIISEDDKKRLKQIEKDLMKY